ncbi:hypothetical protein HDU83_009279 [Entophlyctis luteolus]|nr:hypothetical protein HDU83_009279 [Entophlyctis luteolus]
MDIDRGSIENAIESVTVKIKSISIVEKRLQSDRILPSPLQTRELAVVVVDGVQQSLDLRLQSLNFATQAQQKVFGFLAMTSESLATLIGPTGCGKTHTLITVAREYPTIFLDAGTAPSTSKSDKSVDAFKDKLHSFTRNWTEPNQDLDECRRISLAFVIARLILVIKLYQQHLDLSTFELLLYQMHNSHYVAAVFDAIVAFPEQALAGLIYRMQQFLPTRLVWCIDEAHTLREHCASKIISGLPGNHMQQNGDINEASKRGVLSLLIYTIKRYTEDAKMIISGTSLKLRNVDNFGTWESKPVAPYLVNNFDPWDKNRSISYITSLMELDVKELDPFICDYYRPRLLENLVYDFLWMAVNDRDSPVTLRKRQAKLPTMTTISDVLSESYRAVIHRFTRVVIANVAQGIKQNGYFIRATLQLILGSMLSQHGDAVFVHLTHAEHEFLNDTVGAIYVIPAVLEGFTLYEGYVIDALATEFEKELAEFNLLSALSLLKSIIVNEGMSLFEISPSD